MSEGDDHVFASWSWCENGIDADPTAVENFWSWGNSVVEEQPGSVAVLTLRSTTTKGRYYTLSLWQTESDYSTFVKTDIHKEIEDKADLLHVQIRESDYAETIAAAQRSAFDESR